MPGSYLVLETTNRCSLACVHCSVSEKGHPHHARTGFLDPELVERLFDELADIGATFDTLILFWLGEPLIHPAWERIWQGALRANAKRRVFGKIELHTNGTHLDAAAVRVALNEGSVPQVWHFSLDAARRATYRQVKGRDSFRRVEENIARFIEEKGRLGARWPRPVFQFIVGSNNVDEVPSFRRRWEACCERAGVSVRSAAQDVPEGEDAIVFFRQLDCPTADEQARENAIFQAAMEREGLALPRVEKAVEAVEAKNLAPCSGFWKSPVVGWNGDLTVCTRDNLQHNRVGNLYEHGFLELWWGRTQQERRRRVAQGDYGMTPMCDTCFIPRSGNYTDIGSGEIARHAAWEAAR